LRKMTLVPGSGRAGSRSAESAREAAMGVTIFRGADVLSDRKTASTPAKNRGAPSSLRRRVRCRIMGLAEPGFPSLTRQFPAADSKKAPHR
jgi:hypothetical protein